MKKHLFFLWVLFSYTNLFCAETKDNYCGPCELHCYSSAGYSSHIRSESHKKMIATVFCKNKVKSFKPLLKNENNKVSSNLEKESEVLCCLLCGLVFGNRKTYYKHFESYSHKLKELSIIGYE